MRRHPILAAVTAALSALPSHAQTIPAPDDQATIQKQLEELRSMRREMQQQMGEFDRRISDLEQKLGGQAPETTPSQAAVQPQITPMPARSAQAAANIAAGGALNSPVVATPEPAHPNKPKFGTYTPGKGVTLASGEWGEVNFGGFTYARYLNQQFDDTYTDAFGRTFTLDERNDIELNKLSIQFRGWLFDERFHYLWFVWTSNTSQGDPAQVVVGGTLSFEFDDALTLGTGVIALPTTRSTSGTFPIWLRNDNRTIADEFMRGSYTFGVWASGHVTPKLSYHVMLGNNLSQLGVNAAQLDGGLNTFAGRLWWMPTTGEYGAANGIGDYDNHQDVATLFGVHYSHSREDAQGQPGTEDFENTQLRLSDGTLIFRPDPFGTGGVIRKATYDMLALNAGAKYKGFSFETEAYFRKLSNFKTIGVIPVTKVTDTGIQGQASAMVVPKVLQAYLSGSKIWGDYGDPWDMALGVNWFPLARRELRINGQALYLRNSPVGYSSIPYSVGANGWAFTTDVILAF